MVTATASAMTFDLPPLDELTPSTNGHAGEPTADDLARRADVALAAEAAEAGDELEGEDGQEVEGTVADTDSQEVGGGDGTGPEPPPDEPTADRPPAYPGEPAGDDDTDTVLHDEAEDRGDCEEAPDEITAAREALGEAVLERMALEKQLKRAKKAEKEAAEQLRDLVGRQLELPLAVAAPPDLQKKLINDDPAKEVGGDVMAADPNAWRAALVTDLPLKPAILARLEESGIATIGELEDLRAGAGLRSLKGVGQAKADAIEEAVVVWLSANRDREVFSQVNGAAAEITEPVTAVATPAASPLSTSMPAGIAATDPDAHAAAFIEARAAELLAEYQAAVEAAEGAEPLEPVADDDKCWNAGVEAFDSGKTRMIDCPWSPGVAMDDWLRGWLTAKLHADEADESADESADEATPPEK